MGIKGLTKLLADNAPKRMKEQKFESYFGSSSPLEEILKKDSFTLEELLDEDGLIPECKSLNLRLINFLRDRAQVEKLVHYVIDEAPEDADQTLKIKFPIMASTILTCEVEIILRTLVEDEELMNLFFFFPETGALT